ncbi:MAG: lipopolysaccharide biosynthesis protein [Paludibacteraceae bacterium]|nr:lipopolysaccharide biosynthesis protein [Paludibacteraceae bacterium]
MDNLKHKILGAFTWSSIDRVAQQGVQFLIGIVLARLLSPTDYGLMGMVMIFAGLSYVLVESGFNYALVRTKELTPQHTNTIFYTNLAISVTLYLLLFFTAPYIAAFFNQPQLTAIARVTFLAILFNACYLVPYALIGKSLNYKALAQINLSATLLSGVAGIALAYLQYGVWALVAQQTTYHFFRIFGFYFHTHWKPQLTFKWQVIREYGGFSLHILASSLLSVIFNNIYTFILGKLYPIKQVGYYTQAYKMSETANFTFLSILGATYNLFAQIHDQKQRLCRILNTIQERAALIVIPITVLLIADAHPLFYTLFGEKWMQAVPYFQLICAANLLTPMFQINIHALNAIGKSNVSFGIELAKRGLILGSILIGLQWNILGLLIGYAVACLLSWGISCMEVKRHLQIDFGKQLWHILPALIFSSVLAIICYYASVFTPNIYLQLVIRAGVFLVGYCLLTAIFYPSLWKGAIAHLKNLRNPKQE